MNKKDIKSKLSKLIWIYPLIALLVIFTIGIVSNYTDKNIDINEISNVSTASTLEDDAEKTVYDTDSRTEEISQISINESGNYTSKEEVALYIHTFNKLPNNYITKNEAREQGWDPEKGNLSDILPGMSIGGSPFGNFEDKLPKADGRKYFECDIDYIGPYRNSKRLVYSNDGLIYYTEDHYNTFERLY